MVSAHGGPACSRKTSFAGPDRFMTPTVPERLSLTHMTLFHNFLVVTLLGQAGHFRSLVDPGTSAVTDENHNAAPKQQKQRNPGGAVPGRYLRRGSPWQCHISQSTLKKIV